MPSFWRIQIGPAAMVIVHAAQLRHGIVMRRHRYFTILGFASSTLSVFPRKLCPLNFSLAAFAASLESISTKPNPLNRPVSRSVTNVHDSTTPAALNKSRISVLVISCGRFPTNNLIGINNDPFPGIACPGIAGGMPKVRNDIYGKGDRSPKNFRETADLWRLFLYRVCYFDGELCGSGDLENPRGADEASELSSILFHLTP